MALVPYPPKIQKRLDELEADKNTEGSIANLQAEDQALRPIGKKKEKEAIQKKKAELKAQIEKLKQEKKSLRAVPPEKYFCDEVSDKVTDGGWKGSWKWRKNIVTDTGGGVPILFFEHDITYLGTDYLVIAHIHAKTTATDPVVYTPRDKWDVWTGKKSICDKNVLDQSGILWNQMKDNKDYKGTKIPSPGAKDTFPAQGHYYGDYYGESLIGEDHYAHYSDFNDNTNYDNSHLMMLVLPVCIILLLLCWVCTTVISCICGGFVGYYLKGGQNKVIQRHNSSQV